MNARASWRRGLRWNGKENESNARAREGGGGDARDGGGEGGEGEDAHRASPRTNVGERI